MRKARMRFEGLVMPTDPKPSGMRPSESRWRRRPKKVAPGTQPMDGAKRVAAYFAQNGSGRLTPAQRRRVRHKANAGRS